VRKKLIKNSKPFGKNVRKPQGGFFDSYCMIYSSWKSMKC